MFGFSDTWQVGKCTGTNDRIAPPIGLLDDSLFYKLGIIQQPHPATRQPSQIRMVNKSVVPKSELERDLAHELR